MFDKLRSKLGKKKTRPAEDILRDGDEEWTRSLGVRNGEPSDGSVDDMSDDFGQAEPDGEFEMSSPHLYVGTDNV